MKDWPAETIGYLIDPGDKTIKAVQVPYDPKNIGEVFRIYQHWIGGLYTVGYRWRSGDELLVSEDALSRVKSEDVRMFLISEQAYPFIGKGLVIGRETKRKLNPPSQDIEELRGDSIFLSEEDTARAWAKLRGQPVIIRFSDGEKEKRLRSMVDPAKF